LTTDQKVPGLNPGGVTKKGSTSSGTFFNALSIPFSYTYFSF
jgi:hypothetical protein